MIRKNLATVAKAGVTVIIIWLVLRHVDLAPVASRLVRLGPTEIAIGILPFASQLLLGAERWRLVCQRLRIGLRFGPALQIVTIGTFFNQTLPSAVGGDAVRVWLLVRDGVGFGKAINSVLCDRVLALVVLTALSAATLPLFYQKVADPSARYGVTGFVAVGLAVLGTFLLLGPRLSRLLKIWKITRPFGELATDFHCLFTAPTVTLRLLLWSMLIHVLTIVAAWLTARLLAIDVSFIECLIIIPAVVLITMLPISIAGWGLREGAMVVGFGLVGVAPSDALAVSICFGLASVIVGLPGGVLWLWNREPIVTRSLARD